MDIFDSHYDEKKKELIFPEYIKNKLIEEQIVYDIAEN